MEVRQHSSLPISRMMDRRLCPGVYCTERKAIDIHGEDALTQNSLKHCYVKGAITFHKDKTNNANSIICMASTQNSDYGRVKFQPSVYSEGAHVVLIIIINTIAI